MATLSNFTTTFDPAGSVPVFGTKSPSLGVYPNDTVLLDIYNFTNDYLETVYRATNITREGYQISINVEQELANLQYYSGKYNITARFLRNHLGSGDGDKLVIQEISSDRLEVRVTPVQLLLNNNNNLIDFFKSTPSGSGFFGLNKKEVLPNLYIFKDVFTSFKIYDYVQDPFTFPETPFSIIFKLSAPLSNDLQIDSLVWVAQDISEPIKDKVTVIPPARQLATTVIAGPNFDVVTSRMTSQASDYRNWDEVLSTNTDTSLSIVNKLFSGSLIEGVNLNIDFKSFENYIHFGSAEERIRNFQYKIELLDYYDSRIYTLSQSYAVNYPVSSSLTGSVEFAANIQDAKIKKSALLGGFDSYEKYLYYESASYVTNSFGEFYPTTWPKLNSNKPYVNYAATSSQAISFVDGLISSASQYDLNNVNSLRKLVPEHIYVNNANDQYIVFVDMIGHYFDLIFGYVNQMTSINKRYESLTEGFAKELVYTVGQNLGIGSENGAMLEELWSYFLGTDKNGVLQSSTYAYSVEDRTKEVWKRLITSLPYLLKTKGTARGIRALINCYGIPSTILKVREFGGPEPTYYSTTQEEYDQFYYGLLVGSGSSQVTVPIANYLDSDGATGGYGALELRFRFDTSVLANNTDYELITGPMTVTVNPKAQSATVGSQTFTVPFSAVDTDWWTLLINGGSKAYIGANKYGKALIYSSSLSPGAISSTQALIPGSGTKFYGTVNEFRLWKSALDLAAYQNHILAPTSFQGPISGELPGSTSSFSELKVRHTFGADGKKFNALATASVTSSHPDQTSLKYSTSAIRGAAFTNYTAVTTSYWIPQTETHYLEVIDGGPTRNIANKIRIESTVIAGNQIQLDSSILKSLGDLYPVESPRVGVYFSPTDEVNEDINEQFGGYNLDEFLGDPADFYRSEYSNLEKIKHDYFKKYQKRNDTQGFIRLIQNYDSSLFQLVKQFVPERALLHTGLVVESHILHRSKVANIKPSWENLSYTSSIEESPTPGGDILPLEGIIQDYEDSLAGIYNYLEGNTETTPTLPSVEIGSTNLVDGTSITMLSGVLLDGALNEYNNESVMELDQTISNGYTNPSKYLYYDWFHTGSGPSDWVYSLAVGEDYWNPIQPTILQNALSDIYEVSVDRFNSKFTQPYIHQYISGGLDTSNLMKVYGITTDGTLTFVNESGSFLLKEIILAP